MFLTSSLSLISLLTTVAFADSTANLFLPTFPVVAYPVAVCIPKPSREQREMDEREEEKERYVMRQSWPRERERDG